MDQFLAPETDTKRQFLEPETDMKSQFLLLGPETDIMAERNYILVLQLKVIAFMLYCEPLHKYILQSSGG